MTPQAAKLAVEEAAERPYERAATHLFEHHRLSVCKHTLERLAGLVGSYWLDRDERQVQRHRQTGQAPATLVEPPDRCILFADGVMVHTDGQWHEARVGTVRSEGHLRPVDAVGDGGRQVIKSSVLRFSDPSSFGDHLWRRARELGLAEAKLTAFVGDGAHWLWSLAHDRFPQAIQVLDFYHLCQHVHACADVVLGEASEASQRWAMQLKGTLRAGMVDEALRQIETLPVLTDEHRQAKHALVTYLSNNQQRMNYPRYEKLGLPIGSGEVEAQCKTLVQARCKQAGMRWTTRGAEALLRVRCAVRDGRYATAFGHWPTPLTTWAADRRPRAA